MAAPGWLTCDSKKSIQEKKKRNSLLLKDSIFVLLLWPSLASYVRIGLVNFKILCLQYASEITLDTNTTRVDGQWNTNLSRNVHNFSSNSNEEWQEVVFNKIEEPYSSWPLPVDTTYTPGKTCLCSFSAELTYWKKEKARKVPILTAIFDLVCKQVSGTNPLYTFEL